MGLNSYSNITKKNEDPGKNTRAFAFFIRYTQSYYP